MPEAMKILVVDDEPAVRKLSAFYLRNWGYEVIEAGDGLEALLILSQQAIQLVISDWMMPNLSGLELCRHIRRAHWDHYTYVILCTGKSEKQDLIEGMEAGADDFLVKTFSREELRVRVRAGERVVNLERGLACRNRELATINAKLKQAYERIENDLKMAAWMQANLLPSVSPHTLGVRSEWRFRPSSYVAGDILNIFPIDRHRVAFYVLDVAGHGVPAAMLSVTISKLLTPDSAGGSPLKRFNPATQTYDVVEPGEAVAELNRRFQTNDDQYFTMIYGLLDTQRLTLNFSQAGHPHPLLIRGGDEVRTLGEGGPPVGILPEAEFDSIEVQLQPGDRLLLYSDGVTDCTSPGGEIFGEERLLRYLSSSSSKPLGELLAGLEAAMETWRSIGEFEDDISLLALEIGARARNENETAAAGSAALAETENGPDPTCSVQKDSIQIRSRSGEDL